MVHLRKVSLNLFSSKSNNPNLPKTPPPRPRPVIRHGNPNLQDSPVEMSWSGFNTERPRSPEPANSLKPSKSLSYLRPRRAPQPPQNKSKIKASILDLRVHIPGASKEPPLPQNQNPVRRAEQNPLLNRRLQADVRARHGALQPRKDPQPNPMQGLIAPPKGKLISRPPVVAAPAAQMREEAWRPENGANQRGQPYPSIRPLPKVNPAADKPMPMTEDGWPVTIDKSGAGPRGWAYHQAKDQAKANAPPARPPRSPLRNHPYAQGGITDRAPSPRPNMSPQRGPLPTRPLYTYRPPPVAPQVSHKPSRSQLVQPTAAPAPQHAHSRSHPLDAPSDPVGDAVFAAFRMPLGTPSPSPEPATQPAPAAHLVDARAPQAAYGVVHEPYRQSMKAPVEQQLPSFLDMPPAVPPKPHAEMRRAEKVQRGQGRMAGERQRTPTGPERPTGHTWRELQYNSEEIARRRARNGATGGPQAMGFSSLRR